MGPFSKENIASNDLDTCNGVSLLNTTLKLKQHLSLSLNPTLSKIVLI